MSGPHRLRLLTHKRTLPFDMPEGANVEIVHGDLADRASLPDICAGINCIVYVAGVLFRPHPERFLRLTNTVYAETIVDAALAARVQKFILVSFPHVEEHTTPDAPARGLLNVHPKSIHAHTRLEAEKYLFRACQGPRHDTDRTPRGGDLRTKREAPGSGTLANEEASDGDLAQTDMDS